MITCKCGQSKTGFLHLKASDFGEAGWIAESCCIPKIEAAEKKAAEKALEEKTKANKKK